MTLLTTFLLVPEEMIRLLLLRQNSIPTRRLKKAEKNVNLYRVQSVKRVKLGAIRIKRSFPTACAALLTTG